MIRHTGQEGGWVEMQIGPLVWVAISVAAALALLVIVIGTIWGLRRARVARMVDPADGVLQVTGCNLPGPHGVYSNYRLNGVVSAPGLPPTPVEARGIARATKWPMPGRQLPVRVDRARPSRLQIRWDQVGTGRQAAAERAEQLAEQMRTGSFGGPVAPGQPPSHGGGAQVHQVGGALGDSIAAALRDSLARSGVQADQIQVRAQTGGANGVEGWESASAVVTGCREVPAPAVGPVPPGGVVELSLEVTRANGASYPARTGAAFSTPQRRAQLTAVGTRLPVRVDPTDPTRVAVDPAALGATG